jgi:hypothetical protein
MLFAFVCYALTGILFHVLNVPLQTATGGSSSAAPAHRDIVPSNFAAVINNNPIDWLELLVACAFSVLVGPIASFVDNHKLINKLARVSGITKSFGDADVWDYLQNSEDVDWVTIRDYSKGLSYAGHIKAFSDAYKPRELLLTGVKVYSNLTSKPVDALDAMYLSFEENDISIEVPKLITSIPDKLSRSEMKKLIRDASSKKVADALAESYLFKKSKGIYMPKEEVGLRKALLIQSGYSSLKQKRHERT